MILNITFVDQEFNIELDMETLDFDKLKTLNDIADIIMKNNKF